MEYDFLGKMERTIKGKTYYVQLNKLKLNKRPKAMRKIEYIYQLQIDT